jgi:LacI family transcriptional regulator
MYTRRVTVPKVLRSRRVVLLNAVPSRPTPLISVIPDELEAGRTAAKTLLEAGHRAGIYIIGVGLGRNQRPKPMGALAAVERLQGIKETFTEAGVRLAGAIPCEDWEPELGYGAVQTLVESGADVKSLICFNDRLAVGAYNALHHHDLAIPADVSVVSFDDDPIASWIRPELTTVAIPHYELGRRSIELLLDRNPDASGDDVPASATRGLIVRVEMPLRERASVQSPVTK